MNEMKSMCFSKTTNVLLFFYLSVLVDYVYITHEIPLNSHDIFEPLPLKTKELFVRIFARGLHRKTTHCYLEFTRDFMLLFNVPHPFFTNESFKTIARKFF